MGVKRGYDQGLSPRVRGKLSIHQRGMVCQGSIPACAGEAPAPRPLPAHNAVYPRVCGGSMIWFLVIRPPLGLSPRVRGKRV